ncbi:MAG: protein kinase [Elusimicrobia bacterium]|nr:protein kinase [Elusimicrobiota bacterium]
MTARLFVAIAAASFLAAGCPGVTAAADTVQGDSAALIADMLVRAQCAYQAGDYEKAFDLTRAASAAGDAQAQFNLGVLYSKGHGIPKNYGEAAEWYLKAANQGHRGAMLNLSVIMSEGLAGERDLRFAAELRRLAGRPEGMRPAGPGLSAQGSEVGGPQTSAEPAAGAAASQQGAASPAGRARSPWTRLIPWAGLAAAAVIAGLVLRRRRPLPRAKLDIMLRTICDASVPAKPAYGVFQRYLMHGGDAAAVPAERLYAVFVGAGRQDDLFGVRGLTVPQRLALAKRFSDAGRNAEALRLILDDAVLAGLACQEDSTHDTVRLFERACRLEDLVARMAKAPPEVSTPFAKALLWVGKTSACARMLRAKRSLTPGEERLLANAVGSEPDGGSPEPSRLLGGRYQLGAMVAEGGRGIVYEGFEPRLDRKIAIKKMRREIRADPRVRQHFIAEARMMSKANHPYIVSIHDVIEDGGELYLIMDFVEGRCLSDILPERGRLPLAECRDILRFVCEAVEFAHHKNILHRDLKPGNVMINKEGFALVMDFGLAREAKDTVSRMTSSNVSGSPAYMAPEQHLGQAYRSSDVYSIAAMLYEMLTGNIPYHGPDFLSQKERRVYEPITQVVKNIPKGCDELLAMAFDPDPKTRISSPMAFYERLKAV